MIVAHWAGENIEMTSNGNKKKKRLYTIVFYATQLIGLVAFILAWVLNLPILVIVTVVAFIAALTMYIRYGTPQISDRPQGVLAKYTNLKRFLFEKHYVLSSIILVQIILAIIWLVVLFEADPPQSFSTNAIILAIILSELVAISAALIGITVGKRIRDRNKL